LEIPEIMQVRVQLALRDYMGNFLVQEIDDQIWQVSFMQYDLGYFDMDSCRLEPGPNPFGPKLLTM
jgi:hypothetical protein